MITTSHFVDTLGVSEASHFVTVIQQQHQQNPHENVSSFNTAASFQQQQQQLQTNPVISALTNQHQAHSHSNQHFPQQHQLEQHHYHHQHHHQHQQQQQQQQQYHHHHHNQHQQHDVHQPQSLTCVNVMSTNTDSLSNHLANCGSVMIDQATANGLLRLPHATSVIGTADQATAASIMVNTISELRQQQQQTPVTLSSQTSNSVTETSHNILGRNSVLNIASRNNFYLTTNNSIVANPIKTLGVSNDINQNRAITQAIVNNDNHGSNTDRNNSHSISLLTGSTKTNSTKSNKAKGGSNKKSTGISANVEGDKSDSSARNSESPRRTFACPDCGKGFTEKFNMKRHMQLHAESRPKYMCDECSKSFAWKDNFIRHKKAAHGTNLQQFPASLN